MNNDTRTRDQIVEELAHAKKQMREMREHPYTTFAIAYGDAVGDRIDMLTAELAEFDNQTTTSK